MGKSILGSKIFAKKSTSTGGGGGGGLAATIDITLAQAITKDNTNTWGVTGQTFRITNAAVPLGSYIAETYYDVGLGLVRLSNSGFGGDGNNLPYGGNPCTYDYVNDNIISIYDINGRNYVEVADFTQIWFTGSTSSRIHNITFNGGSGGSFAFASCDLRNVTLNLNGFIGCQLSDITAYSTTFDFTADFQIISNQVWINNTQLVNYKQDYQEVVSSDASTVTPTNNGFQTTCYKIIGGAFATQTITLFASPLDGQVLKVSCPNATSILAITWDGNGNTVDGDMPARIMDGQSLSIMWVASLTKWEFIGN